MDSKCETAGEVETVLSAGVPVVKEEGGVIGDLTQIDQILDEGAGQSTGAGEGSGAVQELPQSNHSGSEHIDLGSAALRTGAVEDGSGAGEATQLPVDTPVEVIDGKANSDPNPEGELADKDPEPDPSGKVSDQD